MGYRVVPPEPCAWDENGEPCEWIHSRDEHGNVTGRSYRETEAQRKRRYQLFWEDHHRLVLTPGQVETLIRARTPS